LSFFSLEVQCKGRGGKILHIGRNDDDMIKQRSNW